MGNFAKAIEYPCPLRPQFERFFSSISLTKLHQYHALFKSLSETFSVDNEEFADLLGSTQLNVEELFQCLDTDHNLLVDGLELFCALTLLSSSLLFSDKIRFLFELFDFNSLRSLSRTDIQFLLQSCCNAVSKIFSISHEDAFVEQFVHEEFSKDQRINISQIIKWANLSEKVAKFFRFIGQDFGDNYHSLISQKIYQLLPPPSALQAVVLQKINSQQQSFIQSTFNLFKENASEESSLSLMSDLNGKPNWIFGIRYKDVRQFIEIVGDEIVYFVGKVAIVYNTKSEKQRFYTGHSNEIISLAVQGSLCASGEYCKEPQIKLWNLATLQTLNTLRGHTQGVHLLLFLPGALVSVGSHYESPIIIHSLESGIPLFSSYCSHTAVDIAPLQNYTSFFCQAFVVGTLKGILHFQLERTSSGIEVAVTHLKQQEKSSRITCVCFFMVNSTFQCLSDYDDKISKFLLSGYQNGDICVWNVSTLNKMFTFSQEGNQILRILTTNQFLYVISDSSFIRVYDLDVNHATTISTIDLTQINQDLFSFDLYQIKTTSSQLLLVTQSAEILFIESLSQIFKPSLSNLTRYQISASKIRDILYIESPVRCQKIVKRDRQQSLYLTQGLSIKSIDLNTHSFTREWNIGHSVSCFDATITKNGNLLIIAATQSHGDQSILHSFCDLSEYSLKEQVAGQVLSILLQPGQTPSHMVILVSTVHSIFKYSYTRGNFSKTTSFSLTQMSPRLSYLEPNRILLFTKENVIEALIIPRQQQQMHKQLFQEASITTLSPLKIFFNLNSFNQTQKFLTCIVGSKIKALFCCRCDGRIDLWSNYDNLTNKHSKSLIAHTSPVSDLSLCDDQSFLISSGVSDGMLVQWKILLNRQIESSIYSSKPPSPPQQHFLNKQALRKIKFCLFGNDILSDIYDQHLHISGLKNQSIRKLFKATLNEWKSAYRYLEPTLRLKLDFVFGIQTFHKNNTILFSQPLQRILYFTGKIVVVYNPSLNNQNFYRGHKFRVTCIALLSDQLHAASGQSSFRPQIYIWNISSLETIRVIATQHYWGILDIVLGGSIILSYGFAQNSVNSQDDIHPLFNLQFHDVESGYSIARGQEANFAYSLALDPTNPMKFAMCTENHVSFWQACSNEIIKKNDCFLPHDTPTACVFYPNNYSSSKPDLLVGTRRGAIGVVSREKYWHSFIKEQKGLGQINCILINQTAEESFILASSEDNLLRVWNTVFEEKQTFSLARQDQAEESKKIPNTIARQFYQNNRSLQSLCFLNSNEMRILGGTRNGELIEISLGKLNLKAKDAEEKIILRFNGGGGFKDRGKVLLAHHPKYDVLATLAEDQIVIFWDCNTKKLLQWNELGLDRQKTKPTAMKFISNGDYLIIGFSDGLLVYLDSKLSPNMQGKSDSKYSQPSLKIKFKQKFEDGPAVVAIQISQNGEYMAVSYHQLTPQKSKAEVRIFEDNKSRHKPVRPNKFQSEKIYQPHSAVENPHLNHSYQTAYGLPCGFAVVSMTFAEYEGSHYLLMIFQLLDQEQKRIELSEGEDDLKYKIRHVSNKTDSANSSSLNELIRWKKSHLFSGLSASYLLYSQPSYRTLPNNHLRYPQFTVTDLLQGHLVVGSQNGDIHLLGVATVEGGGIANTIPAHSCKVSQIQHSQDRLAVYTSGQDDYCVLRWSVETSASYMPQHTLDSPNDLFSEIPQLQYLQTRQTAYKQNFQKPSLPESFISQNIKLHDVMGRRAYGLRNNLKVDKKGRLVYHSGQAIIISDYNSNMKQFLYDKSRNLEEVTTIEVSLDGEILIAAYAGIKAAIVVWGLSSKLLLSQIYLEEEIKQVVYMALSHYNSRLVVYALRGKNAEGCIILIDLVSKTVISTATYLLKPNWHIKALSFAPNSHDSFFTCGVESIKSWHLQSGQLTYIPFSFDFSRIHTCLLFVGTTLITGTDEGQLIVWNKEHKEARIISAHQQMVTCLALSEPRGESTFIASGSQSNLQGDIYQIILWSFSNDQFKQIQQISARRDNLNASNILGDRVNPHYQSQLQVQSLCFWKNNLIIGLLKGDAFVYECSEKNLQNESAVASLIMAYQDGHNTKSLFFSDSNQQLVDISEHGLLRVWSFPQIKLLWDCHFEAEVVDMVYSSLHDLILIGFRGQLKFLRWGVERKALQELQQKTIQFNFLTHLVLSHNEQLVALGIENNSDLSHLIEVYELGQTQFRLKFKMRFDSSIEFIDFNKSLGEKHAILIKTKNRYELYDPNSLTEVAPEQATKLDWLGLGLQIAQKTREARQAHKQISGNLSIRGIAQVVLGTVIIDSSGDMYLFHRHGGIIEKSSLRMSSADYVRFCSSGKWCGVASRWDRNLVIWQLK